MGSRIDLLRSSSDAMWSITLELVMNLVALFWTFMLLICDLLLVFIGIIGYSLDLNSRDRVFFCRGCSVIENHEVLIVLVLLFELYFRCA